MPTNTDDEINPHLNSSDANDLDIPGLKEILWHKMRDDLKAYIPDIASTDLLMCPTCCRFLPFEGFSVEHIIPKQSLADDPASVREAIPANKRAATTLLCNKRLLIKGKTVYDNGCNSWKGRFYDKFLRAIFNTNVMKKNNFTSRHHVALFCAGYLGLFADYGFQITLVPSGLVMRRQFFNPNKFNPEVPLECQMALMGAPDLHYSEETKRYWIPPFKFVAERNFCIMIVRNASMRLPMSRDPRIPIARELPLVPSKYTLRPNFQTFFQ
ncbi:MAG: hypothetical protein AB1508_01655 [Pseudomonadota bacterium]